MNPYRVKATIERVLCIINRWHITQALLSVRRQAEQRVDSFKFQSDGISGRYYLGFLELETDEDK